MNIPGRSHPLPWYRQCWPWLLMAGPFIVIVASLITLWLAAATDDGLVAEDYYRQGLAAGETLQRSERAAALGLQARLRLTSERIELRLETRDPGYALPAALRLTLSHPTRAGLDRDLLLHRHDGEYRADFRLPAAGHWLVLVEDEAGTWRLLGGIMLPAQGETLIGKRE